MRLALAAALLGDPEVLVLDEPANGLDPEGVHWLRGLIRGLADEGRTVLVSSHVLAEVAQTADQLVIIDRGRLVAQSTLAALVLGILVLGTGLAALLRNQVAALIVGLLWWSQGVEQILAGLLKQPGLSGGCLWAPPRR
jgi:ABC-2 type transport system ATP-binding protein